MPKDKLEDLLRAFNALPTDLNRLTTAQLTALSRIQAKEKTKTPGLLLSEYDVLVYICGRLIRFSPDITGHDLGFRILHRLAGTAVIGV